MAAPPVTPGVHIQEKTQGLQLVAAQYGDELRPLVQSLWEFTLPTLATAFSDAGTDQLLWHECLQARSPPCGPRSVLNIGSRKCCGAVLCQEKLVTCSASCLRRRCLQL